MPGPISGVFLLQEGWNALQRIAAGGRIRAYLCLA
jgi:hypothetical protein